MDIRELNANPYQTLIKLCVDICERNGENKPLWLGDKDKALACKPKSGEMILTAPRQFIKTRFAFRRGRSGSLNSIFSFQYTHFYASRKLTLHHTASSRVARCRCQSGR